MHNSLSKVWVVFRDSPRNDGVYVQGVYSEERLAKGAALFGEGLMLVTLNQRLPPDIIEVEKAYYPCYTGTWVNSPHGRWTRRAREVIRDFFNGTTAV